MGYALLRGSRGSAPCWGTRAEGHFAGPRLQVSGLRVEGEPPSLGSGGQRPQRGSGQRPDPNEEEKETKHLEALEGAETRLRLFQMDLLDYDSIVAAVSVGI
ncbi:hypothetical protein Tco_0530136 [Tanacetum coccineum]